MTKVHIFENSFSLTNYFLRKWVALGHTSIAQRGRFMVALSGGKTPIEFYCKLSSLADDDLWAKTHVFLTDERFVSFEHNDSNYRMIREILLDYVNIPESNIHPVRTYCDDPAIASSQYQKELKRVFSPEDGEPPCFDLMLLGIGLDGHTASLFPGTLAELEEEEWVVDVRHQNVYHPRISLTFPVINNSRRIYFIGQGPKKAKVFKHILDGPSQLPAAKVAPVNGELNFLLDKEAASQLTIGESYYHDEEAVIIER